MPITLCKEQKGRVAYAHITLGKDSIEITRMQEPMIGGETLIGLLTDHSSWRQRHLRYLATFAYIAD